MRDLSGVIGPTLSPTDPMSLASSLAPVLADACGGRLGSVTWFKADWQRGGAATGTATYRDDDEVERPVVVKLPVVRRELTWLARLQNGDDSVVPRLYASGEQLDEYDLAWVVIERFEFGPLGAHWHPDHTPRIAEAAARFYEASAGYAVDGQKRTEPWDELIKQAGQSVRLNQLGHQPRWKSGLREVRHRLQSWLERWETRRTEWLHGDLHLANAMSRVGMDAGPVCLIDLAEVHVGHWVEDAVYLERQLWARPERMKDHKPVRAIAAARRARGLHADESDADLAMIRRALLAATAPRFLKTEGNPAHLEACLDKLEEALNTLK